MNCQDIARIIDSGKFGALSASQRRDGEAHALSCGHCAPLWFAHTRLAAMPIPPMPRELARLCGTLVAARSRGSVLRLVPRQMMILVGGFVVLAAAAAVVTMKYVAPALQRAEVQAPQREPAPVAAVPVMPVAPAQPRDVPVIQPAAPQVLPPPRVAEAPPMLPHSQFQQPDNAIQQIAQGMPDMNKSTSMFVAAAALGAAATAPVQAAAPAGAPQRITAEQLIANNDLNKDGIVTREEAKAASKSLITLWDLYDLDHDGRLDAAEIRRATKDVMVGNSLEKITGDPGDHKSMPSPAEIMAANDLNKDGIVTREEATQANKSLIGLWDTYDLNKDGKVDAAEIAKASGY